jgi:membrane fusion protein (multidrug efflux system)
MTKTIYWLTAISLLGMVTMCSSKKEPAKTKRTTKEVKTSIVQQLQPAKTIVLPGDLRPWDMVTIQAKVRGYVKIVRVDRGSQVKKGQTLAELEAPELEAQLAEGLARIEDARAQYFTSKLTYQRLLQMSSTSGAVAVNELDQTKSKMIVDSMQMLSARESYQAKKEMVNYLTITAPFDGVVTERTISPGELVGPEGNKPMFNVVNSNILRLTVAIPELYSSELKKGTEVEFKVNALPANTFTARLSRNSQSLDLSIRSLYAEFDVNNLRQLLKPGMYAEVSLPVERAEPTLFISSSSVVNSTERVFVIQIVNHHAKWVDVKTGTQMDSLIEIFGPLKEGDVVVSKASEEIRDGSAITER